MKNQPKRGSVNVRWNEAEMLDQLIAKGNPLSALRELAVNGFDAYPDNEDFLSEEPYVDIQVVHGKHIRVIDWGEGFTEEDIQGFVDFMLSKKRHSQTKGGRVGSGRTHSFSFAKALRVTSRSAAFPGYVQFQFTLEDLKTKGKGVEWMSGINPPECFRLEGPATGTMIELIDIDWGKVPTDKTIHEELPLMFSWFAARALRINGERLKERPYMQEPLRGEKVIDSLGGLCRWDLYVPAPGTRRERQVNLGARLVTIIGLPTFLRGLPGDLAGHIQDALRDGTVIGDILIPGLNRFRLHDSASLSPKVYEKFGFDALGLLRDISNEAQIYFKDVREQNRREEDRRLVRDLTDEVNAIQGFDPDTAPGTGPRVVCPPPGPSKGKGQQPSRPPFLVNPRNLEIVRGVPVLTTIMGYSKTSGRFNVRVEGKAVRVEKQSEREFLVTGDALGEATIIYFDEASPRKEVRSSVRVTKAAGLQLTPQRAEIVLGGTGDAKVAHPEQLNGQKVEYAHNAGRTHVILNPRNRAGRRSVGIEVSEKCPPKDVTITATVPRTSLQATCVRTIVPRGIEDPPMLIEDRFYRIVDVSSGQEAMLMPAGESFARSEEHDRGMAEPYKVNLFVTHPLLTNEDKETVKMLILQGLLSIHMDVAHGDIDDESIRASKLDQLRLQIIGGIRKKEQKSSK